LSQKRKQNTNRKDFQMAEWLQILLRSVALVFTLFFFTKWLGKKHLTKLNIFDYIHSITVGGLSAILILETKINFFYGLMALFTWFFIPYIFRLVSIKSKKVRDFIEGKSTVFIENGKIMEDNLKKEGYSTDDLLQCLRQEKIFAVKDVEFALLEPSGDVSVMPKANLQPITAEDLHITVPMQQAPETVIMDGKIMLEPLANLGLNIGWLTTELAKMNVTKENVFLARVDDNKLLTVDLYYVQLPQPANTELIMLLVTLEKTAAELMLFSLASENPQSKHLYDLNYERLQEVIRLIKPYLK